MKNFKSFVAEEKPNIKRKAKGEQDFVDAHEVEITDSTDQGNNSAKVTTKANSGKHKNDRADNKQEFGEAVKKTYQMSGKQIAAKMRQIPSLKSFADKFENKPIVTPQIVDKILPDYISGGEITKLFKESVEESVKPDVEKAFPASGVRKHTAPKSSSTMPKDKEKAKGKPAGSFKEETDLEEETQTYMVKFEKNGKVSVKNYEAKSDLDARSKAKVDAKRMGMNVSSVRLKEEVEQIEESQVHKVVKQKDGTHDVHVKTEFGEIKHIGTIHPPNKEGVRVAKYKDGTKVALGKDTGELARRLSGYHGKHMREEVEELDEISGDLAKSVYKKRKAHSDNWKITPTQKRRLKMGIDDGHPFRNVVIAQRSAKKRMAKEEVELDEEQLTEFDLQTEAAYTNPGLERLAAAKKRNQPSHTNPGLEALAKKKKSLRQMKQEMAEADFSKKETKMAHTIGKEFEKKGVGDESQGGPYAVASAMVRDKPEAAKKAYKTIQSKMKEEADAELLFNLYNDLNEENQEMFMSQLEEDADSLLQFAKNFLADE